MPNVFPQGVEVRRPLEYRGAPFDIAGYLQLLPDLFKRNTLQSVIEESIRFYGNSNPRALYRNGGLGSHFYSCVSSEREPSQGPATTLLKAIPRTTHLPFEQALVEISATYLESTRYLLPFIFSFARASHAVSTLAGANLEPHLVLRDGLIFWPSLSLLGDSHGTSPKFLLYTRAHTESQAAPRIFELDPQGAVHEKPGFLSGSALVIDVGLYGTLLSHLIANGWCEGKLAAFFFASRSPFISGWVNQLANNSIMNHARFDLVDIIRLADTVESLLKPFLIYPNPESGLTTEKFSDLISFVCSTSLLWAIYQYSKSQLGNGSAELDIVKNLEMAKRSSSSWFIKDPVERWKKADDFLASWKHGPLFPMNYLCGFKV